MIKPIEFEGYRWKMTFQYTPYKQACAAQGGPNITHCVITPYHPSELGGQAFGVGVVVGSSVRAHGDKPNYETGRKVALKRALVTTPKEFRKLAWEAYLGRKQKGPKVPNA